MKDMGEAGDHVAHVVRRRGSGTLQYHESVTRKHTYRASSASAIGTTTSTSVSAL